MRLYFFVLASLIALSACEMQANKIDPAQDIIIQNSGPRGGGYLTDSSRTKGYTDSTGKNFGYAIFWTGVINNTSTPMELTINFPADSFAIFPSPASYLKLFLLPDTMTLEKEPLYNYGITGLKPFLDTSFHKPTMLQRTINPKEECRFFVVTISVPGYNGAARAGLILKEQDLFYRTNMLDSLIHCGHIVFKK